jgi:hypothetical protein
MFPEKAHRASSSAARSAPNSPALSAEVTAPSPSKGLRFELPSRYRALRRVTVRVARWDLAAVDLIDVRTGRFLTTLLPLDKTKNADGLRRTLEPVSTDPASVPAGVAPLMKKLMADYAATGLPPAFLPFENEESS